MSRPAGNHAVLNVQTLIKSRPALTFFVLTFAVSWGGVLVVVGPGGFPAVQAQADPRFPFVYLAMLAGPSLAGILLMSVARGRAGVRDCLRRLLTWRVGAGWYAIALLTAPVVMTAVLLALSLTSPAFLPGIAASGNKSSLWVFGITVGLGAGFFEELGWTGFALPALRTRHGVAASGLGVGMLWGAWHFLVNVWASGSTAGSMSLSLFLPAILFDLLFLVLPAYRMLMVWVYDRTGSLLVTMLMHASLTGSTIVLGPVAITGAAILIYDLALAVVLWLIVAAIAVANGGQLSPRALRRHPV